MKPPRWLPFRQLLLAAALALCPCQVSADLLVGVLEPDFSYPTRGYKAFDPDSGAFFGDFIPLTYTISALEIAEGPDGNFYTLRYGTVARYERLTGVFLGYLIPSLSPAPKNLAFAPNGDLMVNQSDSLLRFGPDGTLLDTPLTGLPALADFDFGPDGDLYVLYGSISYGYLKGILRFEAGTGALARVFGSAVGLQKPSDIAVGPDGLAYVTSEEYAVSQQSVFVIDPETGVVLRKFADLDPDHRALSLLFTDTPVDVSGAEKIIGDDGDGVHALAAPKGLAALPDGTAFVTDYLSNNVFRIDPDGSIAQVLDASGGGTGVALSHPIAVALAADGTLFVASGKEVFRVDPLGAVTHVISSSTYVANWYVGTISDIATTLDGSLFLAASETDRVVRIAPYGTASEIIDLAGDNHGNWLEAPMHLAVGRSGNVYVSGADSDNLFEITPGGAVTEIFSREMWNGTELGLRDLTVDGDGNVFVVAETAQSVFRIAADGAAEIVATAPPYPGAMVGVDKYGHLFVTQNDRIVLITAAGQSVEIVGPAGPSAGNHALSAAGLGFDDAGRLYATTALGVLRADVAPECANGIDDDGDGDTDHPADVGCFSPASLEDPECDDSVDNDGDGRIDWDGGPLGAPADPQCTDAWRGRERSACGLGGEIALLLGLLAFRRRRGAAGRRS